MNKKLNGFKNVYFTSFGGFIARGSSIYDFFMTWGSKTVFNFSCSHLYLIGNSKMAVILHIYIQNHDVIQNIILSTLKHIRI